MSGREHRYEVLLDWTGDRGQGTGSYAGYGRDHLISDPAGTRPPIAGTSDPAFRGDPDRWNPEQLLLASLSACHQLWYLHLCAVNKVTVVRYADRAEGWMAEDAQGSGRFTRVLLHPQVAIAGGDPARAMALHGEAHRLCFIANSVNFPVEHAPSVELA